jgi:hypothetical protein
MNKYHSMRPLKMPSRDATVIEILERCVSANDI